MDHLKNTIDNDYKTAMKAGERVRVDTLRLIKAGIQRVAIDKRKDQLEDKEIIQVLSHQAKQCKETIEAATKADRQDILSRATEEIAIINTYLPQQLTESDVKQLIEEAVKEVGLNQGQIMKYVMAKAAGATDGKIVSGLVGKRLNQSKN